MTADNDQRYPLANLDADTALRTILEGTASATGTQFFDSLVRQLARTLGTDGAWVTEYLPKSRRLRALSFWMAGNYVGDFEYAIDGTPCRPVIEEAHLVHVPDGLRDQYPDNLLLEQFGAVSFMGTPLKTTAGLVMGHLCVLDSRPMPPQPRVMALFQIFADRATAELQRLRAEQAVREREEKLSRLIDSTMDAIIELDSTLKISIMNPAATRLLGAPPDQARETCFMDYLPEDDRVRLMHLIAEIDTRAEGRRSLWIPGGLRLQDRDGRTFQAEATLSRYELQGDVYHTLVLRNVNERIEAEQKIRSLTVEAEYLREEIKADHNFDHMIGESDAFRSVLTHIERVARTDATVLVLGETGTGKELIARALHAAGNRSHHPLIKVNCAAIPAALIESEFFGHEKGAFTGATQKRLGRFALADSGTIFLDEVAELPLDVQSKLLRVLQEGEFELVGSSTTRKVDVRIIAATNRDLEIEVREGRFRTDLYYRLNVYPIVVPPLRERGRDSILLAQHFADQIARRIGRPGITLTEDNVKLLQSYHWPGNVRELQNIMERAMIAGCGERIDLARVLPLGSATLEPPVDIDPPAGSRVYTVRDLVELERQNLLNALETAGWRVAGDRGAARLLGVSPSTFNSRMKALGIRRPGHRPVAARYPTDEIPSH